MSTRKDALAGKQNSITFSPSAQETLERLVVKKGLRKSIILAIALEKYAREEEGNEYK